jgi:hypothetical protein
MKKLPVSSLSCYNEQDFFGKITYFKENTSKRWPGYIAIPESKKVIRIRETFCKDTGINLERHQIAKAVLIWISKNDGAGLSDSCL